MSHAEIERDVAAHYTPTDLTNQLIKLLGLEGAEPGTVPVEALFPADQLHHGGVGLTEKMAAAAGVQTGARVLDAGSGIGGSARWLVHNFNCSVEAIDLSDEFFSSAGDLDVLVGLEQSIGHRVGSVTDLPYEDASFDVVWSQNVTMNVPDKALMFSEALRVSKPGGVYVLSHLAETGSGPMNYPLPWAMTEKTSFAAAPQTMVETLADAGFADVLDHAKDAPPSAPPPSDKPPLDAPAMGARMDERRANTMAAVKDGRLVPMLITAKRP